MAGRVLSVLFNLAFSHLILTMTQVRLDRKIILYFADEGAEVQRS